MKRNVVFSKSLIFAMLTVILGSFIMSFVDGVWQPGYLLKSLIKLCLFLGMPALIFLLNRDAWLDFRAMLCPRFGKLSVALLLSLTVYGVIIGGYFSLRGVIDFSGITKSLTSGAGVSAKNFLWVALYISFVNSFLEELFFRGFSYSLMKTFTISPMYILW